MLAEMRAQILKMLLPLLLNQLCSGFRQLGFFFVFVYDVFFAVFFMVFCIIAGEVAYIQQEIIIGNNGIAVCIKCRILIILVGRRMSEIIQLNRIP